MRTPAKSEAISTREAALGVASALFYREGVRAVGMELIVKRSGIAKTTIYRHFPTKDALIQAFLESEDVEFWQQWDEIVSPYSAEPREALHALCRWISAKLGKDHYRGCPQINVAAEFADPEHPARKIARRHKSEMVDRITQICRNFDDGTAELRGQQLSLLFDGAFTSDGRLRGRHADALLIDAVDRLIVTESSAE